MKYSILSLVFIPFCMNAMFYTNHDPHSVRRFLQRQDDPEITESKLSAPLEHYELSQKEESDLENALGEMQKLLDQGASIHDYYDGFHLLWKVSISVSIPKESKRRLLSFLLQNGSNPHDEWKAPQEAFFKNSVYEMLEMDPELQQWATCIREEETRIKSVVS